MDLKSFSSTNYISKLNIEELQAAHGLAMESLHRIHQIEKKIVLREFWTRKTPFKVENRALKEEKCKRLCQVDLPQ